MKSDEEIQNQIDQQRLQHRESFDKLTKAIGEYILSFESLMAYLKTGIALLFKRHAMNNQSVVDVVISDMTAAPLLKLFDGMIAVTYTNDLTKGSEAEKLMDSIYEKIIKEYEYRNKIAHTGWFLQQSIHANTFEIATHGIAANSKRIKRHKGVEVNFPGAGFDYHVTLIQRTKDIRDLERQMEEILINIRERKPLTKKWFE